MIDLFKAIGLSVLILAVLAASIVGDFLHRLFWSSPIGWQIAQFEARRAWYFDHKPAWEKWLFILGVRR